MATRRYRVHALIGQGGFGKVYRATLEGGSGFRKEVAIKLLKHEAVSPGVLERFRDEARILGLVRDRAFVSVDPPLQLAGSWAVVMDFAEGESARGLLRHGPYPGTVALEVVEEVARALGLAWHQVGPEGRPLHLLHRDLKPGNIQISAKGEVRLLDFGIAKATFGGREALTANDWAGTVGYAAPERMDGRDGPEGDVYSLGVVLRVLLTLDKPIGGGVFKERGVRPAGLDDALALAAEMTRLDPDRRPAMRQVEARCHAQRRALAGPTLREWAEQAVDPNQGQTRDEVAGAVWEEEAEDRTAFVAPPPASPGHARTLGVAGLGVLGGLGVAAALATLVAVVVAAVFLLSGDPPAAGPAPVAGVEPEPELAPAAVPAPVAVAAAAPAPVPAAVPRSTRVPAPVPVVVEASPPAPVPAPPPPAPEVAAPVPTRAMTIVSDPWGADVWIDGVKLDGKTPFTNYPVGHGRHVVRMQLGEVTAEKALEVGPHGAGRILWTRGQDLRLVK